MTTKPFVLAASWAFFIAPFASAQTATGWTGAVNNLWSGAGNWDNGAPPGGDTNTRSLFFGNAFITAGGTGSTTAQNDLTGYNGHRITFEDTAAVTDPAFTITGNAFSLFDFGGVAPRIENQSTSLQIFNLGANTLTLNGTSGGGFAEINPVGGDLRFSNAIVLAGTTQLRVFGNNGKVVTFNGVISGTNSVSINQNSSVVYGAGNTYTGDTFINAGSLSFAQGGSLSGGTLQLGDTNSTGAAAALLITDADGGTTIARPIVVRAGSSETKTIGATNSSGTNTFSGTVALNDIVIVDAGTGSGLTLSGIVSGTGSMTKTGNGLLTLSAANTFTGGLQVNGGTVRPTAVSTMAGGITVNTGGTLETNTGGADSAAYTGFFGVASNLITLNGGRLLDTNLLDRTVTNRPIAIGAAGGTIETTGTLSADFIEGTVTQLRFATAAPTNDILTGSGTITKNGAGRLTLNSGASPNFSGAWVINNGTVEALAATIGNGSVTNTVTLNGGILATSGGNVAQAITLNGGALATTGANRIVTGAINVTASSHVFLNDFWRDFDSATPTNNIGRTINHTGVLTGDDPIGIAVNRAGYDFNNGSFILQNPGNTYSGTITVGKNLKLESNPTSGVGKALGTANIVLADGGLNLRDNGTASGTTLDYGNNVSAVAPTAIFNRGDLAGALSIDVNRTATGTFTGVTFRLGTLSLTGQVLNVTGGNGYGVEFGGASTFTGNVVFNPTTASLAFSGGLTADAAGRTLTKNGAGTLIFTGPANYTGATTVNGGALTLSGSAGTIVGTPSLTLTGAALNIDNSAAIVADRVSDSAPISLSNSSIAFTSLSGTATNTSETVGVVTAALGANIIAANQGNAGAISALTLASLSRQNSATVRLNGTNLGQVGNSSRIILADQVSNVPYLGAWLTINGVDFAQYVTATDGGFARGVTAVDYLTDPADDSGFSATQNLRLTGTSTTALTADRAINTVNFANAANTRVLDLAGNTLTLAGGGILVGTNAASITGTVTGGLTSGSSEIVITNNAALSISAPIKNNAGAVALIKSGAGTLTLSGASTFTGDLKVQQGTLSFSDVADAGTPSNLGSAGTVLLSEVAATTLQFTGASDATNRQLAISSAGATLEVTTAASNLAWNGAVASTGPLTKIGAGTFTLGGITNVTANVTVNAGTLGFGGNATISGDLNVGTNGTNASLGSVAGGTLSVGNGSSTNINIGSDTGAGSGSNSNGTANLSNLSNFTANVANIRVGVNAGSGTAGIKTGSLILAQNNTITATTSIVIGDNTADGTNPGTRNITFGSGTNDITTPLLTVGGRKYSATGSIAAGGTLILDNGAGRTALNVGTNTSIDTGTTPVALLDLTGGTVTASLSNVNVGIRGGGGATGDATGTLNFGSSATNNVNVNVATGFAMRIGGLDFSTGTQPTGEVATGTVVIGGGTHSYTSTNTGSSAIVVGHFNNTTNAISTAAAVNGAVGTLTISGGNVTITSAATTNAINLAPLALVAGSVGTNTAAATLNISGGSLTVNNQIGGNSATTGSTSTLSLTGGLLNMAGKNLTNLNNLTFSGGALRNVGTLNRALTQTGETSLFELTSAVAGTATISGAYSVTDGDVNIAATRVLSATSATIGGSGSIVVNGSLQGSLTVNTGATISGAGTTQALNLAGGTISPGNSPGILNTGNLALGGGNLVFEANSIAAGTGYDQINVVGTVSLSANTNFTLSLGYVPAIGDQFTIIANDSTDLLSFSNGALFAYNGGSAIADDTTFTTVQGYEFRLDYNGGSGNDVVLTTTIPEPASAVILLAGLGSLLGVRRRSGRNFSLR